MSEAKARAATRLKLLRDSACVFCGGSRPAKQIDHVPAKIIFANKVRPKGLEFAACAECNQGTKDYDQIVGLFSRLTLSATPKNERRDLDKLVRAFRNNYPKVIAEIEFSNVDRSLKESASRDYPSVADQLITTGPIVNSVVDKFGAKLGFALHFAKTGRIVSQEGGAFVWLLTNESLVRGEFPHELVSKFPEYQSLKQGLKNANDQFGFSSLTTETQDTIHIAYFRLAFFLMVYVSERSLEEISKDGSFSGRGCHRPGEWSIPFSLK